VLALIRSALDATASRDPIDISDHNTCTQTVPEETERPQESKYCDDTYFKTTEISMRLNPNPHHTLTLHVDVAIKYMYMCISLTGDMPCNILREGLLAF
jgi:hypothetical protein